MCKGCRGDVLPYENKVNYFSVQLKVELGLQVREEFDKIFRQITSLTLYSSDMVKCVTHVTRGRGNFKRFVEMSSQMVISENIRLVL